MHFNYIYVNDIINILYFITTEKLSIIENKIIDICQYEFNYNMDECGVCFGNGTDQYWFDMDLDSLGDPNNMQNWPTRTKKHHPNKTQ